MKFAKICWVLALRAARRSKPARRGISERPKTAPAGTEQGLTTSTVSRQRVSLSEGAFAKDDEEDAGNDNDDDDVQDDEDT